MHRSLFLLLFFGLAALAAPAFIAPASAAPRAAVLNGNDNTLSLVDLATGQSTLNAFTFPGFPGNAVVRSGKLYVAVSGADLLMVLDATTLDPLDTLRTGVGTNPYAVAVNDAGDVYASLFLTNQVVKFDAGGAEVGRVAVGRAPEGLLLVDERLYVAETETARLWSWEIIAPGEIHKAPWPSPHGGTLVVGVGGHQRFDSLAVDGAGYICVATLINGGITVVSPDGGEVRHIPLPDFYPTNICFGGPDLRTAFVTLSGKGKLVAFEWERPGLRLNYAQ